MTAIRNVCRSQPLYAKLAIRSADCGQRTSAACARLYDLGRELLALIIASRRIADSATSLLERS
jgi:hypothetical protein